MSETADSSEHHSYQVELEPNIITPDAEEIVAKEIVALVGSKKYSSQMVKYHENWYCISDKPLDELIPRLEQIDGVKKISEFSIKP